MSVLSWFQTLFSPPQRFTLTFLLIEIAFLIVFGVVVTYDPLVNGPTDGQLTQPASPIMNSDEMIYHYFKDVFVMMVVGFGFRYSLFREYSFSGIGHNLMLVAMVIQWAIIMNGSWTSGTNGILIFISVRSLLNALFTSTAVLVSFGAVLGRLSPLQYLVMGLCEVPIIAWNEYLGRFVLYATDAGHSIFHHGFGAFFGLGVAVVLYKRDSYKNINMITEKTYFLISLVGTLFLWVYWPSYNSAMLDGNSRPRAQVNTILGLSSACLMTYMMMGLMPPMKQSDGSRKKDAEIRHFLWGNYNIVYFQNATIAGGVALGACANMMLKPVSALIIGAVGGFFSVITQRFITKYMNKAIFDSTSVLAAHGVPSFVSVVASAVAASVANAALYADELYYVFPALSPTTGVTFVLPTQQFTTTLNYGRGNIAQGGFQILAWVHTFGISLVGGLLTGLVVRYLFWCENKTEDECFVDEVYFELTDGYTYDVKVEEEHEESIYVSEKPNRTLN